MKFKSCTVWVSKVNLPDEIEIECWKSVETFCLLVSVNLNARPTSAHAELQMWLNKSLIQTYLSISCLLAVKPDCELSLNAYESDVPEKLRSFEPHTHSCDEIVIGAIF